MSNLDVCSQVRGTLQWLRADDPEWSSPELSADVAHLHICPACQAWAQQLQAADRQLQTALHAVAIPAGLTQRLLGRLQTELATTATTTLAAPTVTVPSPVISPAAAPARRQLSRRALGSSVAAVLLAGLGSWWLWPRTELPEITVPQLMALLATQQDWKTSKSLFTGSFAPQLPSTMDLRYPADLAEQTGRSVVVAGQEVAAIYTFDFHAARQTWTAVLLVADLRRVRAPDADTLATAFAQAESTYPPGCVARAWRQGDFLYISLVRTNRPDVLETLRPQFHVS